MEKLQCFAKKILKKEFLPLLLFALIQLIYHMLMQEPEESDAMWFFCKQLDTYSLKDYLTIRYQTWASRIFIEAVLVYISRYVMLWKVIDWIFWVFLAWALTALFPKEKRGIAAYIVVGFLLVYPMWNLRTAGWIATSANYSWPLALGAFSLHGTVKAFYGEKSPVWMWILYALAALYGANMEQMSAVLLAVNVCAVIYFIIAKKPVRLYGSAIIGALIAAGEFIFIMTCPGNAARKAQETINWMPNFGTYNLIDKISMGFVDTMHHLITSGNVLYLCYVILLAVLVFFKTEKLMYRIASILPVGITVWFTVFFDVIEDKYPSLANLLEKNAFIDGRNYHFAANYIPTIIYLVLIGCMLLSMTVVCGSYFELFGQGILLGLALATRVIMGFTPTIYVSQERTFFYLYMLLGISGVYLLIQNLDLLQSKKKAFEGLKISGAFIVVLGVLVNLAEVGNV